LSPWPDVFLPMVAAGEMVYLAGLVSLPRFRTAVDAEKADQRRQGADVARAPVRQVLEILAGLPKEAQQRFGALRSRCLEMRAIAEGHRASDDTATQDLWTPALDRLLYGFLRLQGQQARLRRFLRSTSEEQLKHGAEDLKARLATAKTADDQRMVRSLEESVAIAEQRLDNYRKANKNAEFADLELDRVEAKIQALIEMAANRQDPNLLSSQVDAAAESMNHTEATLNQLQQISGVTEVLDSVPPILDPSFRQKSRDDA